MVVPPVQEPEFVGSARHALVEGMLAVYDEVAREPSPRWLSLEAPSGWGKTRLARELFSRLAAERQSEPHYWPGSILTGADVGADDVGTRRKRVNPVVSHVQGSLPSFAWWGLSCTSRNGTASVAIAEDVAVLEAHAPYLEDAWLRLPRTSRAATDARAFLAAVADEAAMEVGGRVVEAALGAAVPGLGVARWVAEWGWGRHQDRSARSDRLGSTDEVAVDRSEAADAVVEMVVRLARPGLPAVLFIEDLHEADPLLLDVVQRVVTADASVLVVSTGWPGHLEESAALLAAMTRAGERLLRITSEGTEPLPHPFSPAARLEPLPPEALATVLRFYYPLIEEKTAERLVERYTNPLALELFCQIPKYRRRYRDRPLVLTPTQVEDLPSSIRDLYRELWQDLPESVREALAIATLGIPAVIDPASGRSQLWNVALMAEAMGVLDLPEHEEVEAGLEDAPTAYAWARVVTETLRRFVEPDQLRIASDELTMFLDDAEIEVVNRAVAARLGVLFNEGSTAPDDEREHGARLLLALHSEGFDVGPDLVARAVLDLLELLRSEPAELHDLLRLADVGLTAGASTDLTLEVSLRRAQTLVLLEQDEAATVELNALVPRLAEHFGPRDRQVLTAEIEIAWLLRAVRPREALGCARDVVERATASLGPTDRLTLDARSVAIGCLNRLSLLSESLEATRLLLEARRDALGDRDGDTLTSLNDLAAALREVGHLTEAWPVAQEALALRSEVFGPTHGATLKSRSELARLFEISGDVTMALTMWRAIYDDTREFLGERHPTTLWAMDSLCQTLSAVGLLTEALALSEEQVSVVISTFGAGSTRARNVRSWHAVHLRAVGDWRGAVELASAVADESAAAHGSSDPRSVRLRITESETLRGAGRTGHAVAVAEALVRVCESTAGEEPALLASALLELGLAYAGAQRLDASAQTLERAIRLREEHVPDDLNALGWVAVTLSFAYYANNHPSRAVELVDGWRVRCEERLGPLSTVVVALRVERCLATQVHSPSRAADELAALDESLSRTYPAAHYQRIRIGRNLGIALRADGRLLESGTVLGRLTLDLAATLGAAHPETLTTASELFTTRSLAIDRGVDDGGGVEELSTEVVDVLINALPAAREQLGRSSSAYRNLVFELSRMGGDRWGAMLEYHEDAADAILADPASDPVQQAAMLGSLAVSRLHADDGRGSLDACYRGLAVLPGREECVDPDAWDAVSGSVRSLLAIIHGTGFGEWEPALHARLDHLAALRRAPGPAPDVLATAWEGLADTASQSTLPTDDALMVLVASVLAERLG